MASGRGVSSNAPIFVKIIELVFAIFCVGLIVHPFASRQMGIDVSHAALVNVAYSSCIIINSIILISHALGEFIPKRSAWLGWKRHIKAKAIRIRGHMRGTGGGEPTPLKLTPLEERLVKFMTSDVVYGLEGIQVLGVQLILFTMVNGVLFVAAGSIIVDDWRKLTSRITLIPPKLYMDTMIASGVIAIFNGAIHFVDVALTIKFTE